MCTAQECETAVTPPTYFEALHNNFMSCRDHPDLRFQSNNGEMVYSSSNSNNNNSHNGNYNINNNNDKNNSNSNSQFQSNDGRKFESKNDIGVSQNENDDGGDDDGDDDMMGLAFCNNMSMSLDEGTYARTSSMILYDLLKIKEPSIPFLNMLAKSPSLSHSLFLSLSLSLLLFLCLCLCIYFCLYLCLHVGLGLCLNLFVCISCSWYSKDLLEFCPSTGRESQGFRK